MDIILIAVEFGNHKIRSSRVLYSVLVKVGFSHFLFNYDLIILYQLHGIAKNCTSNIYYLDVAKVIQVRYAMESVFR